MLTTKGDKLSSLLNLLKQNPLFGGGPSLVLLKLACTLESSWELFKILMRVRPQTS